MKNKLYSLALLVLLTFSISNGQIKTDVWDFGAAQLDISIYNNQMTADIINAWYPGITPGTTNTTSTPILLPTTFTVGDLTWVGGTNDRLRSSNTNLTRYDSNGVPITAASGETLTGYIYVNASAATTRYLSLTLNEDDEVSIYAKSQNGTGKMTFINSASGQTNIYSLTTTPVAYKYVAKTAGTYKIYDTVDKPFYYRVLRKAATYVTLSGTVDITNASDIPAGYTVKFTNAAGKVWTATPDGSNNYTIQVPAGYSYTPSLGNANGYIITNTDPISVSANTTYNSEILKVTLYTVSGNITGLSAAQLLQVGLVYTPTTSKIYIPHPTINTTTGAYSVQLEDGVDYIVSATGVNDYYIPDNTVNITANTSKDVAFSVKPTYQITINTSGLDATQLSKLHVTFTNLNESGYTYTFTDLSNIYLRDGVYSISCSGLNEYPLKLGATSNLTVLGAVASKDLAFVPVTDWSFDDATITNGTTTAYKGMLFSGSVYNEITKGHLVMNSTSSVAQVPLKPGQKMIVYYYYSASFNVDGGTTYSTSSGSTSLIESKEFVYGGSADGYMSINNVSGTSYFTDVKIMNAVPYSSEISVGADKTYHTINDALDAVRCMNRAATDTVKIMLDPGNYEEMLVIDVPNVTLSNASSNPSIDLSNHGVDIDANAVRITSYYGHGYNYFSMGTNQKWNADALRVNKENGYTTYTNTGSGTTNGSYWNATVVVSASGFRADNIIFENSYNQYISKKESEDVVQEWTTGGKGTRPTTMGSTAVQDKSFVERAAAIAYTAGGDRSILNKCRVIGRQDSFYGAEGARVVAYKGALMGATDYIFGGMTLVCYQTALAMNTSEVSTDVSYITAAQQNTSRGFLMYECTVTSATPTTETASLYRSKPGYFGRPWQPTTSEVVFYSTTIETSNNPSYSGQSLILPIGWNNSLGGTSDKVYEYNTTELSGVDNSSLRASWSHVLINPYFSRPASINVSNSQYAPALTEITTLSFTQGSDNWDPISMLKSKDIVTKKPDLEEENSVQIFSNGNKVFFNDVNSQTKINIYSTNGALAVSEIINNNSEVTLKKGIWIIQISNKDGNKSMKVILK